MGGSGCREGDDLGNVLRGQGSETGVDPVRMLDVTAEAHQGELGLYHAWRDFDEPHWLPEVLPTQRAVHGRLRVFGGGVAGAVVIGLQRGDRGHGDQHAVPGVDQLRQQRPGHPERAEHVSLPHPAPLIFVGRHRRLEPLRAAGVVHQHPRSGYRRGEGGHRVGV